MLQCSDPIWIISTENVLKRPAMNDDDHPTPNYNSATPLKMQYDSRTTRTTSNELRQTEMNYGWTKKWTYTAHSILHYLALSCTILYYLALYCTILHCIALSCTILHYLALSCTILHHLAPTCTILHHLAQSCTILHHVEICCTMLHQSMP